MTNKGNIDFVGVGVAIVGCVTTERDGDRCSTSCIHVHDDMSERVTAIWRDFYNYDFCYRLPTVYIVRIRIC